ncbi:MAG: hypothetical protein WKG07_45745 [Hymenobacter sp.]
MKAMREMLPTKGVAAAVHVMPKSVDFRMRTGLGVVPMVCEGSGMVPKPGPAGMAKNEFTGPYSSAVAGCGILALGTRVGTAAVGGHQHLEVASWGHLSDTPRLASNMCTKLLNPAGAMASPP